MPGKSLPLALLALALLAATASGQNNYQRDDWSYFYSRYWFTQQAPDPTTSEFEVSKIAPLPPYTRAKFNDLWLAFREQYGVRDGLFVKWNWSDSWLEGLRYGRNSKPQVYKGTFEIVSGLGPDGKPTSDRIRVKRVRSASSDSDDARLDQDRRGRTSSAVAGGSSDNYDFYSGQMVLADKDSPRLGQLTTMYEWEYSRGEGIYYEVALLPDTPVNQTRFVEALKAGSQFRVILPREVACKVCDGIGRPSGTRVLGAKCRNCGGSGKVKGAEICTVRW
jgi:hypothetical protein